MPFDGGMEERDMEETGLVSIGALASPILLRLLQASLTNREAGSFPPAVCVRVEGSNAGVGPAIRTGEG